MTKIALVLDKSQAYLDYQKESIRKSWNIDKANIRLVNKLSEASGVTLFGDLPLSMITLEDPDQIKAFVKEIEEAIKNKSINSLLQFGLIITSSANRNSTKKLEALVSELGGKVIAADSGKGALTMTEKLVSELHLNREVRQFLIDYLGDDYEGAISIVRSLSEFSKEVHQKITIEDLYIRLPQAPGSVPPWEIEKFLWKGDSSKTIEIFRRVENNSHYLVILSILKNKVLLAYRAAMLIESNPNISSSSIAKALGVPDNYPLKLAMGNAKSIKSAKLKEISEMMIEVEANVKGYSAAPGKPLMEVMLMNFIEILRR